MRILFLMMVLTVVTAAGIKGQGFLTTQGKDVVDENGNPYILRGMGLGGWMLQEGYMLQTASFATAQYQIKNKITELVGEANMELFYEAWLNNHITKRDIDSLKSWGFNSVRLPMHYNLFTLPIEDEPVPGEHTWLDRGFELTDQLIEWCKLNEMYVILDLHAAPGGQGYDQAISDYDPTKPSLWESEANRDKTVALWKKLAERYVDEPWVGGYDLLNEPNWNLSGNTLLRDLYEEIIDSIRTVDNNHIIIIEGNWFANDFTGLTPPFDDNMMYGPHKYWSVNDQASIQWVLDIQDQYDVPLYLGESGENSNVWFRDAIRLLEDNGIGWAWWPMKKVESISGPLSILKTTEYQELLTYWEGNGPIPNDPMSTLMQLAENLKMENCVYQKDVIDAMFRQVYSDETIPFADHQIPGIIYPEDFDLGVLGSAYYDLDVANYAITTGSYSPWNTGWTYRNDAVDIEKSLDNTLTKGFNVGWLNAEEWMKYSVEVLQSGIYDISVRVAAGAEGGRFNISAGEATLTSSVEVSGTGGWQNWQTITIPNVLITTSDTEIRFNMENAGFNLGGMEFTYKSASELEETRFLSGETTGTQSIQIYLNKPLKTNSIVTAGDFSVTVNGASAPITSIQLIEGNTRIIEIDLGVEMVNGDEIKASYTGTTLFATDDVVLSTFSSRDILNTIFKIHDIPGKIEAEDYFEQSGVQLESTSDIGGGYNIGYLDNGDYVDFKVNVAETEVYSVTFRTASESSTGQIDIQLVDEFGEAESKLRVSFPSTGGWQTWGSTTASLPLDQGEQHMRLLITAPLFNLNWFEFAGPTSIDGPERKILNVYPNPSGGLVNLRFDERINDSYLTVLNSRGQLVLEKELSGSGQNGYQVDLLSVPPGLYIMLIKSSDSLWINRKVIINR